MELNVKDANREETVRGYRVKVSHQVIDNTSKADRMKSRGRVVKDKQRLEPTSHLMNIRKG
jgi:hypothetical protein